MSPGLRFFYALESRGWSTVKYFASVLASLWSNIDNPISMTNHVELVFDDEERVSGSLQLVERREECLRICWMLTRGWLVKHVNDAKQIGVNLSSESQALQLTGRQRGRTAFEREITETEIE